jgi:hypothetical protein
MGKRQTDLQYPWSQGVNGYLLAGRKGPFQPKKRGKNRMEFELEAVR